MKHLVILTVVFAVLKKHGYIDWGWIVVVSPALVGHAPLLLRAGPWFIWTSVIYLFGFQPQADACCARWRREP